MLNQKKFMDNRHKLGLFWANLRVYIYTKICVYYKKYINTKNDFKPI